MPKAVLTTKVDPSYDDLPEHRYHCPQRYLKAAKAALGKWIVYYEPRRTSANLSPLKPEDGSQPLRSIKRANYIVSLRNNCSIRMPNSFLAVALPESIFDRL